MLELGEGHETGHREVGEAAAADADLLVVVGAGAAGIAEGAADAGLDGRGSSRHRTPRRRSTCCEPGCATATSSWSRPPAAIELDRLVDASPARAGGEARAVTVELIQGLLLAFALVVILMPPTSASCDSASASGSAQEGPESHYVKEGTPTMGGLLIVVVVLGLFFLRQPDAGDLRAARGARLRRRARRVRRLPERRTGEGISARQKLLWLIVVAVVAAYQIQQTYAIDRDRRARSSAP